MTPIERAEEAKRLLQNPVFKAACEEIRLGLVTQMEASGMDDVDTHHHVALALQMLKLIKVKFQKYADEIAVDKAKQKHESFIEKMRAMNRLV